MHRDSRMSGSESQMKQYQPFPWCSHEHSPVSMQIATETAGDHSLKCGGDLAHCQVQEQWRPKREEL